GTVCVVGKMRDLILQLSKSSIYSTKSCIYQGQQINLAYIRLRHFEFTNGRIISDFNGMGKVKYHFLTIKRVLFLVYQTISIHSKPLEIIKTQVFHWLIYSHMK
ncbi:hypothetical protein V9769_08795, partial [Escherichia coli]|uniref:hypothetical protein n=1 Tax=Escherichia coli TaxID=562 RepID=UPI00311B125A